jgi:hypothetical protein
MSDAIFYQCLVIDNNDPLMLGRVRATLLIDNYQDIIKSFDSPPWNEQTDPWTDRDPFIFNPLLPYFIYQVPKINELIQSIYVNKDFKYQNQYYVQNAFYSPTSSFFTYQEGGNKFTGTGMRIKGPKPLKNKEDGSYTEKGIHYGVFPEPGDNAILGRGSSDLIIKENDVLLRAGKFKSDSMSPNVLPTANQQRGFLQISRFSNLKIPQEPKTYTTLNDVVLSVKYLIEWTITNPENNEDKFCGAVYLYQLKPDLSTNTENLSVGTSVNENLKQLVESESFLSLSKTETINFINTFIKKCNNNSGGSSILGTQMSTKPTNFPIFYRPSNQTYSILEPSVQSVVFDQTPSPPCPTGPTGSNSVEFKNIIEIFSKIRLNPSVITGGYGLIYKKNTVGKPVDIKTTVVPQSKYVSNPTTFSTLGADKVFLLSHYSSIPGKRKIDLNDTLYGISNDKFSDDIIPNTSSMVRGEVLLELINLIVWFLTTHTHSYPGLPPVPVTQDGTTTSQILTELQNAVYKILNENIRIN